MYATLTDDMKAAIKAIVKGRTVYDLGAETLSFALELVGMGAEHVTCIDRHEMPHLDRLRLASNDRINWKTQHFSELMGDIATDGMSGLKDVLLMSWPVNWTTGLSVLARLHQDAYIIYLGSNRDGTACGSCELFFELMKRDVQVEIQHQRNDLIIYKPGRREFHRCEKGELTREEIAYAERVEYEWSDARVAFQLQMP